MKRLNFTIILSLLVVTQLLAQEKYTTDYEVQYKVSYSIDSTHLENKQDETVYLYTGSKFGVFMNYNMANAKKIKADFDKQIKAGGNVELTSKLTNFHKVFYKDLQSGKVMTKGEIAGKSFKFGEPNMPVKWTVNDSRKKIINFSAQKATTHFAGRDYIAWFTTEVPIHDGPYLFSGLPGLIVELYDSENEYHFTLESLHKLNKHKTWTMPKAKEVTKNKFEKFKTKAGKNSENNIIHAGNVTMKVVTTEKTSQEDKMDNEKMKRRIKKQKERRNNPIELK